MYGLPVKCMDANSPKKRSGHVDNVSKQNVWKARILPVR